MNKIKKKIIQKKLFEDKPKKVTHNKKVLYFLIAIVIIIVLIFAILLVNERNTANTNEQIPLTPNTGEIQGVATNQQEVAAEITTSEINSSSTLQDFYLTGKPSFIVFAGTYCSHCRTLVPELETEIWDNYKDQVNIWVNVIDGKDGKTFDVTRIAQGYNPNLNYDTIMGDCGYVPAYVVLDKDGSQILRSCGGEKTIAEIKEALDSQLN